MENTIPIPSGLEGFINTNTLKTPTVTDRSIFLIDGTLQELEEERICPKCGARMHIHDIYDINLSHIPFGRTLSAVRFEKHTVTSALDAIPPSCRVSHSRLGATG